MAVLTRQGLLMLEKSANQHSGITKQIIGSIAKTRVYEKGIFSVFDTIDQQFEGLTSWGDNSQTKIRGYIQIVDSSIRTYDRAIRHLESGRDSLLRRNFKKQRVPQETIDEFFRLSNLTNEGSLEIELQMFQAERNSLKAARDAFAHYQNKPLHEELLAQSKKYANEADQFQKELLSILKERLHSDPIL